MQQLVERRVDVDRIHAGSRNHHVAGGHVRHADHALQHLPALRTDDRVVLGVHQGLDQLGLGVWTGVEHLG